MHVKVGRFGWNFGGENSPLTRGGGTSKGIFEGVGAGALMYAGVFINELLVYDAKGWGGGKGVEGGGEVEDKKKGKT